MITVNCVLKSCVGEVIGYRVANSKGYMSAVSAEKAKELGVQDADILDLMDFPEEEVLVAPDGRYALIDKSEMFLADREDDPWGVAGDDKVVVYGHVLRESCFCPLDNEYAIARMLAGDV